MRMDGDSKMIRKYIFTLAVSGFLVAPVGAGKVDYLNTAALTDNIDTPVQGCTNSDTVTTPMITWGGDVATIYANGNSAATSPGSIFDMQKLRVKLVREDVFVNQVKNYMSCKSPYLRGTLGMLNLAAEATEKDPRTKMVVIYQMTWSAGGDAMVVKTGIKSPKDLKGKTIAVQAYGPHIDYLTKILADAGLGIKDVTVRWVRDLTGSDQTPMAALYESDIDAAMVIIPDALALTSNGTVGTGAESSVKGARILLSTKTADRIIADVYVVREDYFKSNRDQVERFVRGLIMAEESLTGAAKRGGIQDANYKNAITGSAELLLDSRQAIADTEAMYTDARFVGWQGNVHFFATPNNPRSFTRLNTEIQTAIVNLGLARQQHTLNHAKWNYDSLKTGNSASSSAPTPRFDTAAVAQVVAKRTQQATLEQGELFNFEVHFKPNQNDFNPNTYAQAFDRTIDLASTYGGAVITVEGHADPLSYLKKKKAGENELVLSRIQQAAKNLSLTRAMGVRDSLITYARSKSIALDESQFALVGHGISQPKKGMCGSDPCAPKTEQEWLDNMRVEFRMIQVEAEENVFRVD